MLNILTYGGVGDGVTDNSVPIQKAINAALTAVPGADAEIYFPTGKYLIKSRSVVPAIYNFTTGVWTGNAGGTVTFKGAGIGNTSLVAGAYFQYSGMVSYATTVPVSQFNAEDITFDGNFQGAGGTLPMLTSGGAGALISLPWPGNPMAAGNTRNGRYHTFTRCRFYRPTGYGFQPTQGVRLLGCDLEAMGQPGQTVITYDSLGSGAGEAFVIGCSWKDSQGNYADFVSGTPGDFIRLVMTGCNSSNHLTGGIYACGQHSVITGNSLTNTYMGDHVGYDGGTAAANRAYNVVSGNCFVNLNLENGGLSAQYHDLFEGLNIATGAS
jgi:hypothetical protein